VVKRGAHLLVVKVGCGKRHTGLKIIYGLSPNHKKGDIFWGEKQVLEP